MKKNKLGFSQYIFIFFLVFFLATACKNLESNDQETSKSEIDQTAPLAPSIKINNGDESTDTTSVILTLSALDDTGVYGYFASESGLSPEIDDNQWQQTDTLKVFTEEVPFNLSEAEGEKQVYVWFFDEEKNISAYATGSITYVTTKDVISPQNTLLLIEGGSSSTSSTNLNVTLYANDNKGITAYYLSEIDSTPDSSDSGWISITLSQTLALSVNYTITAIEGNRRLYAWLRDAGDNISNKTEDSISYITSDVTPPQNGSITLNSGDSTTDSLILSISLAATDTLGVTGYYISSSITPPLSTTSGWISVTSATSYSGTNSFVLPSGDGLKTVYSWFIDASENISDITNDTITLVQLDTEAPENLSLLLNNGDTSTDTLDISTDISATDNQGATAYFLSENGTTPLANDPSWDVITSTTNYLGSSSFTLSNTNGDKWVYLFFKDAAGNVSTTASASILFEVTPSIGLGSYFSCALTIDGNQTCWGRNNYGQLGVGNVINSTLPLDVSTISETIQFASGGEHTCALQKDGTIKCWGRNTSGQLGIGSFTSQTTPQTVFGINTAVEVAAGALHTCARLSDNTVRCWGENNYGQLGLGMNTDLVVPAPVSGITTAAQLGPFNPGAYHSCVVLADQTIQCWGRGTNGQLGEGAASNRNLPVVVSGITSAKQVTLGYLHTCAIVTDSTGDGVQCWGYNGYGQLGDSTLDQKTSPVTIATVTDVKHLAGGYYHTCAAAVDGGAYCWGRSNYGQLGNGTNTTQTSPFPVTGITNASTFSIGIYHSCAVLDDGVIKCWGYGAYGQLGVGVTGNSYSPVKVSF